MAKAAVATVAIRSISVKWFRDFIVLWLRRIEPSRPLGKTGNGAFELTQSNNSSMSVGKAGVGAFALQSDIDT
jgi:hypothetical protein